MHWFIFISLTILFVLTPYQKGLYFNSDIYGFHIIIGTLFLLMIIRLFIKKEVPELKKVFIILLLPLCYLISLMVAETPKGAWDTLLRWVTYSAFFLLLYWTSLKPKIKILSPMFFQFTGVWITFFMLLSYYGIIEYRNTLILNRFSSVFQYPNTFAMVLGVFLLFSLINLTRDKLSLYSIVFYSLPLIAYFVCFIQTYSRGMMLVFPVVWFIGLALLNVKKQIEYILYSTGTVLCSLIVYFAMTKGQALDKPYPGLGLFLITTIILIALIMFAKIYSQRLEKRDFSLFKSRKFSRYTIPTVLVVLLILGFLDITNEGLVFQQLPERLQDRVSDVSIQSSTAKERLLFFKDTLEISQESPFIGFGGQAWSVLYKKYQELPYQSNKVHNGYFEWLLDTGWIGLITFLIVMSYFFTFILLKYSSAEDRSFQTAIITSLLTIFIHSFIDFNFSYGTIWFLIFWLLVMGIINKEDKKKGEDSTKANKWMYSGLTGFSILVLICIIISYRFMHASQFYNDAKETKRLVEKQVLLEKAVAYDPNNTVYLMQLGKVYATKLKNTNYGEELHSLTEKMASLEPNNSKVLFNAATLLEMSGDYNKAISYYDKALSVDYYNTQLYEKSIALKTKKAIEMYKHNLIEEMDGYIKNAQSDYQQNQKWYGNYTNSPIKNKEAHNSRGFEVSNQTKYLMAFNHFLLKDYEESLSILNQVTDEIDSSIETKVLTLKIVTLERLGQEKKSEILLKEKEGKHHNLTNTIEYFSKKY
jgi:tetratricopeptide (TPR) repeat protein